MDTGLSRFQKSLFVQTRWVPAANWMPLSGSTVGCGKEKLRQELRGGGSGPHIAFFYKLDHAELQRAIDGDDEIELTFGAPRSNCAPHWGRSSRDCEPLLSGSLDYAELRDGSLLLLWRSRILLSSVFFQAPEQIAPSNAGIEHRGLCTAGSTNYEVDRHHDFSGRQFDGTPPRRKALKEHVGGSSPEKFLGLSHRRDAGAH